MQAARTVSATAIVLAVTAVSVDLFPGPGLHSATAYAAGEKIVYPQHNISDAVNGKDIFDVQLDKNHVGRAWIRRDGIAVLLDRYALGLGGYFQSYAEEDPKKLTDFISRVDRHLKTAESKKNGQHLLDFLAVARPTNSISTEVKRKDGAGLGRFKDPTGKELPINTLFTRSLTPAEEAAKKEDPSRNC